MSLFDLSGDVAFVTGAGKTERDGLADAAAGADVACYGHASRGGLDETAARVRALGRKAVSLEGSVTDAEALARAVAAAERELGPLTIGVNNAGVAGAAPAEELTEAQWRKLYDVNVSGVMNELRPGVLTA